LIRVAEALAFAPSFWKAIPFAYRTGYSARPFNQRHAVLVDTVTEHDYLRIHLSPHQAFCEIYTLLFPSGLLGFEYGFSRTIPRPRFVGSAVRDFATARRSHSTSSSARRGQMNLPAGCYSCRTARRQGRSIQRAHGAFMRIAAEDNMQICSLEARNTSNAARQVRRLCASRSSFHAQEYAAHPMPVTNRGIYETALPAARSDRE